MNTFHYHDSSLLCIRHCCNNTKKIRSFSSSSSFPHYVEARQVLFMSTLPFPIYPALPSPERSRACPALPYHRQKKRQKQKGKFCPCLPWPAIAREKQGKLCPACLSYHDQTKERQALYGGTPKS